MHRLCCSEPVHALQGKTQYQKKLEASSGQAYPPIGEAARPPRRVFREVAPYVQSVKGKTQRAVVSRAYLSGCKAGTPQALKKESKKASLHQLY